MAIFLYYHIQGWLQLPAQGAHLWRQADCLAMVWNFKLFDASFFLPQMFNLASTDGKGIAEFPIFYYVAAQFSQPELVLRLIHGTILTFGSYRLYALAYYFLKNNFYAFATVVLFISSPLILFYGTNFLTDVPALCFNIVAFSYYFKTKKNQNNVVIYVLFVSIATLLKGSYILYSIGILLFEYISNRNKNSQYTYILPIVVVPIIWYVYAHCLNKQYQNEYYFLSSTPVFSMSWNEIILALWRTLFAYSKVYFWQPASIVLVFSLIVFLIKQEKTELTKATLFTLLITIIYLLLFLQKLIIHEYYYAFFYTFIIFSIIILFKQLNKIKKQAIIKSTVVLFLCINIAYCKNEIYNKLSTPKIDSVLFTNDFQKFLNTYGCTQNKTVFCFDDISLNQNLYAIKRKGYTQYNNWQKKLKENKIDFVLVQQKKLINLLPYLENKQTEKQKYDNYYLVKIADISNSKSL